MRFSYPALICFGFNYSSCEDVQLRFEDGSTPSQKNVIVDVKEATTGRLLFGFGVTSGRGVVGNFAINKRNFDITDLPSGFLDIPSAFTGGGQRLILEAAPGTEVSRYRLTWREPDIFRRHQRRIGLSLTAAQLLRIFDSHDEERVEYGFELSRQLTLDSAIYSGFRTGNIEISNLSTGDEPTLGNPLTVPRALKEQEGKNDLAYVSLGYRLRKVDTFIAPHNGFGLTLDNRLYSETLGSTYDFVRHELSMDWWDEFDEDPDVVSPYYHLGVGLGLAWAFGDTASTPYSERFYLGGQRTMRGFRFRGVGPNMQGFPAGGQSMFFGTAEYRHPLVKQIQPGTYREIEQLQAGLFIDVGVLDPREFTLESEQVRVSAGFLFGISIPIPITFSFGWPLREGPGDRTRVLGFDIGF